MEPTEKLEVRCSCASRRFSQRQTSRRSYSCSRCARGMAMWRGAERVLAPTPLCAPRIQRLNPVPAARQRRAECDYV